MSIPEVSPQDGAALVDGGALLLDVREEDEWVSGRAPTATWIALGTLEARVREVPSDRVVVCICRSGGRSAKAAAFLAANGIEAVNLTGGMQAWAAAGLPVEAEGGGTGTVI
jgi:rhodanese-related sulfurtransferase